MMVVGEFVLILALLRACLTGAQDTSVDICVIGAGPSGIQAAYSAEAKGLTVAVFEKNAYVGGKTKSVFVKNNPEPYFMGAIFHAGSESSSIQSLFDEFGVQPYSSLPATTDFKGGVIGPPSGNPLGFLTVNVQLIKYVLKNAFLGGLHGLYEPSGLSSNYPKELNQPFRNWLDKVHLPKVDEFFWTFATTFGYGSTSETPAVYIFKYLTHRYFLGLGPTLLYPFQTLLQRMAESLNGTVFLNARITNVQYGTASNIITFNLEGNATERRVGCGATIIAFPQTAAAMPVFTPPDQSAALSDLVSQVKTTNYFTILLNNSESYLDLGDKPLQMHHVPESAVPDNPAINLAYHKQQAAPNSSIIAYYLSPSEKTDVQALSESLASYSVLIGRSVDGSIVQDFCRWEYFPHVSTESLDNGFYEKFDALQGQSRQYYTGALFHFEKVPEAMAHGKFIVVKYFSG